jgi:predicted nucleotidyltransferase
MGKVDDAFKGLKTNLEISETERKLAVSRHHLIRDHIRTRWDLEDDFLTGSYARHTKTKKLKDIDIFVVIDPNGPQAELANGTGDNAVKALQEVLSSRWKDATTDANVVRIDYAGEEVASYEVAPVFARPSGFVIPNGSGWMATDPSKHAELVTSKNRDCDSKFVPLVKMLKGVNRHFDEPIDPPFLIEVMALELVDGPIGNYQDEISFFLASAADQVELNWPDPAGLGDDVNGSMPVSERKRVSIQIREWLAIAEDALLLEQSGQELRAVARWKELFGWRMPQP